MSLRVAVTRDEREDGAMTRALRERGFEPVACAAVHEEVADDAALGRAASRLEAYDWLVVSSVRAVHALAYARGANAWPPTLRGAAVGAHTAQALREHRLERVITGRVGGADALLEMLLAIESWPGRHVLAPRAEDGRRVVERGLEAAGARVEEVAAYRTAAVPAERLRERWQAASPEAAVIASPSAARALVGAIGAPALCALRGVVAIGPTTAAALRELRVPSRVAKCATFEAAAETLLQSLADLGGSS